MANRNKSWSEVRGQRALDEQRIATYRRLMEAQERLEDAGHLPGKTGANIADVFDAVEAELGPAATENDLYLGTLTRYVAALGGRLELQAVFPEGTVELFQRRI